MADECCGCLFECLCETYECDTSECCGWFDDCVDGEYAVDGICCFTMCCFQTKEGVTTENEGTVYYAQESDGGNLTSPASPIAVTPVKVELTSFIADTKERW